MKYRITVMSLVVLAMIACTAPEQAKKKEPATLRVNTKVVTSQAAGVVTRYVGTIEPARETPLSFQSAGRVVSIHAKNGQRVQKGQTIAQIDNTQALNALHSAEAALRHAQDGYDRVSKVHEKGVVSDQKMVEIESQLAQAKSLYAAAKQQLSECTLTAPCDGVVNGLNIEKGQTIIPGKTICSLLDVTGFCVRFTVPEGEISKLQVGNSKVNGEVECVAVDTILPITITEKGVTANNVTHTYDVIARVEGGSNLLMTGMVGKVKLRVPGSDTKGDIIIPAKCILLKPEGPTVWLKEQGRAIRKDIIIDGYQADGVRVKSGLQEGDSLITDGYQKLYNDCKVICE